MFRGLLAAAAALGVLAVGPAGAGGAPAPVRYCTWTWACAPPPRGPNIHPNKHGYAVMAAALARVLGRIH